LAFATFSFGGYGLALAALALVGFGAYDSYPKRPFFSFFSDYSKRINVHISPCGPNHGNPKG